MLNKRYHAAYVSYVFSSVIVFYLMKSVDVLFAFTSLIIVSLVHSGKWPSSKHWKKTSNLFKPFNLYFYPILVFGSAIGMIAGFRDAPVIGLLLFIGAGFYIENKIHA
ncbi:hypothetical protein C1M59_15515 [Vibrio diazotrophicus]|nr:hypothetical protein C1M59_15515 [Vibrio diazotrophicus]